MYSVPVALTTIHDVVTQHGYESLPMESGRLFQTSSWGGFTTLNKNSSPVSAF